MTDSQPNGDHESVKIAVYGAGGVGGYFGGRLAEAGADVHLIARGDHLEALRQDGLRVRSVSGDFEVALPDGTVSRWMEFAEELGADSYSSLHYDMTHDKPMELEALHGTIVRRGNENEIDVPMNEAVYAILRPWVQRNRRIET